VETYSHTADGRYWANHEWLTEAMFYAAYSAGGLPLLAAVCAAAITGAWLLSWRMTRGNRELRLGFFAMCLAAGAGTWALRPQALSMLLFTVVCGCLATGRLLLVPVIVALWVNLHGAAVVALVAVAGAGVAATIHQGRPAWPLFWTFVATSLATGASPLGFGLYRDILDSLDRSQANRLVEWLPPDGSPVLWPFWAIAAATPLTLLLRRRHIDGRTAILLGIALAVLPLAMRSARNVHLFLLVAIPAVGSALNLPGGSRVNARSGEREHLNGIFLLAAIAVAGAIVAFAWSTAPRRLGWTPINEQAVRAVESCEGPLYNTFFEGGALIWFAPTARVFIDNRQDPYPSDLLRKSRALEADAEFESLFAEYAIRCAAVPPSSPIASRLLATPGWHIVHHDSDWVILQRP
jgi:hypothetical protein